MNSKARIVVASVLFVGFLFGAVFPTRTYVAQQREISAATERHELFSEQNRRLRAELERLQSDDEIEKIARARFNLVKPGEEAYAILPVPIPEAAVAAPTEEELAAARPPHPVVAWVRNTLERVF